METFRDNKRVYIWIPTESVFGRRIITVIHKDTKVENSLGVYLPINRG